MYLPESFEWMILNAGVVQEKEIMEILKEPEKYKYLKIIKENIDNFSIYW